jgi:hypothetical protein
MLIRTAKSLEKTLAEKQYFDVENFPFTHDLLVKWDIDVFQVTEEVPYEVDGKPGIYKTVKLESVKNSM